MSWISATSFTIALASISVLFSSAYKKIGLTENMTFAIVIVLCLVFLATWTYDIYRNKA